MIVRKMDTKDIPVIMELLNTGKPYVMAHHEYLYWMLSEYASSTSFVAKEDATIIGFVGSFISLDKQCIFVWQIIVDASKRGRGIGHTLLEQVVQSAQEQKLHSIQFSIDKGNLASNKLFTSFAKKMGLQIEKVATYREDATLQEYVYQILI